MSKYQTRSDATQGGGMMATQGGGALKRERHVSVAGAADL